MDKCRICSSSNLKKIVLHGVCHSTIGDFDYRQCLECGCIQINDFPTDMSLYYSEDYYSMHLKDKKTLTDNLLLASLRYSVFKKGLVGKLIQTFHPHDDRSYIGSLSLGSSILDIGCGGGALLKKLSELGFSNLYGCDPFINNEIENTSFHIYKKDVKQMFEDRVGKYSLVMFNQSLEHVTNPLENLIYAKKLLDDNGTLVVTIPILTDFYWKKWGTDFYILDPPRHFFTFTPKSIRVLFENAGLQIINETMYHDPVAELLMKKNRKHNNNYKMTLFDHFFQTLIHYRELNFYKKNKIGFCYTYVLKSNINDKL